MPRTNLIWCLLLFTCLRVPACFTLLSCSEDVQATEREKVDLHQRTDTNYLSRVISPGLSETALKAMFGEPDNVVEYPDGKRNLSYKDWDVWFAKTNVWRVSGFSVRTWHGKVEEWSPNWVQGYYPRNKYPPYLVLPNIDHKQFDLKRFFENIRVDSMPRMLDEAEVGLVGTIASSFGDLLSASNVWLNAQCDYVRLLRDNIVEMSEWDPKGEHFNQKGEVRLRSIAALIDQIFYKPPPYLHTPDVDLKHFDARAFLEGIRIDPISKKPREAEKAWVGLQVVWALGLVPADSNVWVRPDCDVLKFFKQYFPEIRQWGDRGQQFNEKGEVSLRALAAAILAKYPSLGGR
jgi:hypothetical protein